MLGLSDCRKALSPFTTKARANRRMRDWGGGLGGAGPRGPGIVTLTFKCDSEVLISKKLRLGETESVVRANSVDKGLSAVLRSTTVS